MSNRVYEIVTEKIISLLDKDIIPWHKPWRSSAGIIPISIHGRPYRGINPFLLNAASMTQGYKVPVWLTFKQAGELGGGVKPGEKSSLVIFWKTLRVKEKDENGELKDKTIPFLRYFNVFNYEQCAGLTKLPKKIQAIVDAANTPEPELADTDKEIAAAIKVVEDAYVTKPPVKMSPGAQAAYSPVLDIITIARKQDFESLSKFAATLFHEFTHSTGAEKRVNRKGIATFDHFGSGQYADEELVAEFGSALLCAVAGVDNNGDMAGDHAAYIQHWKSKLEADPRLIVHAASRAQRAVDYIMGTTFEQERTEG